jgi:hypothetical protein
MTKKQKELMGYVNQVNVSGTWENEQGHFYCETGKWKPWSEKTVEKLVENGLVTIIEYDDGVYLLAPKVMNNTKKTC